MTSRRSALALGLAAALAAAPLAASAPAYAEDEAPHRIISLSATGTIYAVPDRAVVTIGVQSDADTAAAALRTNSASMQAVIDMLREQGLEERDIRTSQFTVEPRYEYDDNNRSNTPRLVGYRVTNTAAAVVRDLTKIGAILDLAVQQGSNRIDSVRFEISDPGPIEDRARRRAVNDLLARAELYADAADVELGPVLTISEGGGYSPAPQYRAAFDGAEAASVPIATGEQAVEVHVTMTWELR
jgi:hypothetical protein